MERLPTSKLVGPLAAVLAVGFIAGFALRSVAAPSARTEPPAEATSGDPAIASQPERAAAVDGPGPTRIESGVPAGFTRSEAGAVAAATSFLTTGQALIGMDPLAAEEAIRQMASAATADRQVDDTLEQLRGLRDVVAGGTGPIVYRQAALAYRVDSFDRNAARLSIWHVGVFTRDAIAPPQAGWSTSTFELAWERGDWKIVDETVLPGPAPMLDGSSAPSTSRQLIASLDGFSDFGALE